MHTQTGSDKGPKVNLKEFPPIPICALVFDHNCVSNVWFRKKPDGDGLRLTPSTD